MKELLKVAVVQYNVKWHSIGDNLKKIDTLLHELKTPVDVILLPEMFATGFTMQPELFGEDDKKQVSEWLGHLANSQNASILGSFPWKHQATYLNRLICISPGEKTDYYDKRHLFAVGNENLHYHPGKERITFQIKNWTVFPTICYDLRFPVWCRNNLSYDLMINVANWPSGREYAWNILLKSRAIENQCYVVGVNRTGTDLNNIRYKGNSKAVSMQGEIIAQCDDSEQVMYVELDKEYLNKFRAGFPFLKDQDLFQIL